MARVGASLGDGCQVGVREARPQGACVGGPTSETPHVPSVLILNSGPTTDPLGVSPSAAAVSPWPWQLPAPGPAPSLG